MPDLVSLEPVDYLVVGHVAHDLTPEGPRLGGTAAYSALTARALGVRAGVVTAVGPETSLAPFQDIPVVSLQSPRSTTFENIYSGHERTQYVRAQAARIDFQHVPDNEAPRSSISADRREMDLELAEAAPAVASRRKAGCANGGDARFLPPGRAQTA
jgi:hypothetical protein